MVLDPGGWVEVHVLLGALAGHGRGVSRAQLENLVASSDKQRFELSGDRIRAAQGHSVDVDLGLEPLRPPGVLFHGTHPGALESIRAEGLLPMGRRLVHLSATPETAEQVGARRGRPVVLRVDAVGAQTAGHPYYRSANGVWLTDRVPPEFIL